MPRWIKRCLICKIHLEVSYPKKICFPCEKHFRMIGAKTPRINQAVIEQELIFGKI